MESSLTATSQLRLRLLFLLTFCLALGAGQSGDFSSDIIVNKQTTYACQFSILELTCPEHHVIRITRANYGRFTRWICNPQSIIDGLNIRCYSTRAVGIISSKCDGHTRCEVPVSEETFGDPCPGTSKYVEVQHYCEPAKPSTPVSGSDSGLKPLPDDHRPLQSHVPVPENVRVCVHPSSMNSIYDLYWEMPESPEEILHFNIQYTVNGETLDEDVTQATKVSENAYMFAFRPLNSQRSFDYTFAIKALALNIGWGEYSQFHRARHCIFDENGGYVTLDPVAVEIPSSTPRSGGGLRQMCGPVEMLGVLWPATEPEQVQEADCPQELGGNGKMYYKCLYDGWDRNGPETDYCYEDPITTKKPTTTTTSTTTTTTTTTISPKTTPRRAKPTTSPRKEERPVPVPVEFNEKISSILHKLDGTGSQKKVKYNLIDFLPDVTQRRIQEIEKIKDVKKKKALAEELCETMLDLSEDLVEDRVALSNMSAHQQRHTAAAVLESVETSGFVAASTLPVGASAVRRKSSVVMKMMNVDASLDQAAMMDDKSGSGSSAKVNQFSIPPDVLRQAAGYLRDSVPVVFVIMRDISEWLTPRTEPATPNQSSSSNSNSGASSNVIDATRSSDDASASEEPAPVHRVVNTDVMSVSLSRKPMKHLVSPVTFVMQHRQMESVENPRCSFWDTELGAWSTEGCRVTHSNKTHTSCSCNHLTSFAVLMDITGSVAELPAKARFSLELITYIGCAISILCLLFSWVTFTCFKNLDSDRNTIHKHLVFCLMVAQIVLVTGIAQTHPPVLCSIIAGVLHFFFLAAFAWMCLEGVQLYVMLIEVFESEHSRLLYYYLFGYGVPAIIVAVSAAVFSGGYGTETHCWLTVERGFIWSFVGPACAVLLVNLVMLCIAITIMVRHSSMSQSMRQKTVSQKMRSWVKGAVVLAVLLGLTWVFGVMYLENVYHTLIFSYVFTVLNSLQGLFIFLFHCLCNDKVQKEYRRMARRCHWLPDCVRARYGYTTSSGSKENSSSGNVMGRLFRGKKKRQGDCGDSSSNSAKPFLHREQRHPSSSLDGVVSSRLSSEPSNNNSRKLSEQSAAGGHGGLPCSPHSRLLAPGDGGGMAGDLSEVLDCSVVDSEFVTEYCAQHLQVSMEKKRYSTSSEDSGDGGEEEVNSESGTGGKEEEEDVGENLDRLAALSVDSLSKRLSHLTAASSTSDLGVREGEEEEGKNDGEGVCECKGESDVLGDECPSLVFVSETQPLMLLRQTESERVLILNAANKPKSRESGQAGMSPSLTHIPTSPGDSGSSSNPPSPVTATISVPCLKFMPADTTTTTISTDATATNSSPNTTTGGAAEPLTSTVKDAAETEAGGMNSLPDLSPHAHTNGTALLPQSSPAQSSSPVARHSSSNGHVHDIPFSEC